MMRNESTGSVIRYLVDVPEALPALVRMFVEEWAPYYGSEGPGDAQADLLAACSRNRLPICLVSLDELGEVVGTVSLRAASFSHFHLTPWVAALLVAPGWRRRGIGSMLIAAAEDEARRLGYQRLYIATDSAAKLVERRGWNTFDTVQSLLGPVMLYATDL
jgi:GNAT superfamily N-acetyltransferase